jgi:VIT1/CCC1 family predicted Fe2+/Mn2+ transporter
MSDDFNVLNQTNVDLSQEIPTYKRASDEANSSFSVNRPGNKNPENKLNGRKSKISPNDEKTQDSKKDVVKGIAAFIAGITPTVLAFILGGPAIGFVVTFVSLVIILCACGFSQH